MIDRSTVSTELNEFLVAFKFMVLKEDFDTLLRTCKKSCEDATYFELCTLLYETGPLQDIYWLWNDHELHFDNTLTNISIPHGVKWLSDRICLFCRNLSNVEIPNTVESIGTAAFSGCKKLKHVEFPNSVTSVGDMCFMESYNIETVVLPENITKIGMCTFYNCSKLKNVVIPDAVTTIEEHAFNACASINELNIPRSVNFMGNRSFANMGVVDFYYSGTKEQWESIEKTDSTFYNTIYTCHCRDGIVSNQKI